MSNVYFDALPPISVTLAQKSLQRQNSNLIFNDDLDSSLVVHEIKGAHAHPYDGHPVATKLALSRNEQPAFSTDNLTLVDDKVDYLAKKQAARWSGSSYVSVQPTRPRFPTRHRSGSTVSATSSRSSVSTFWEGRDRSDSTSSLYSTRSSLQRPSLARSSVSTVDSTSSFYSNLQRPAPAAQGLRERIDGSNIEPYVPDHRSSYLPRDSFGDLTADFGKPLFEPTANHRSSYYPRISSGDFTADFGRPLFETAIDEHVDEILETYREEEPRTKDIIFPVQPLAIYVPPLREPSLINEGPMAPESGAAVVYVEDPLSEKPQQAAVDAAAEERRWWKLFMGKPSTRIPATITVLADKSTVILPYPPNDTEKPIYVQTRRLPLYLFGTMSFLSVSIGMWFFTVSSVNFYWFGVFVGLIQIYLIISYTVGYFGRDFSLEEHKQVIEEHSYSSDKLPSVDIYLPCCHEPLEVLENTYKYVSKLDYANYKVFVLDDGGLDTVKRLAESFGFNYITRDNKPYLKKAGNLRYAFARTEGEFFVIFDADFCPRPDFLAEMLPYMNKQSDLAIIQSPQFFRPCAEQTWVEQGASSTQELFYRAVQVNRNRWGASICVGSNAVYRRAALVEVGGTAEIGHSEDVHTGFYALTRGWKLRYIPLALACGVSPDTPRAFFSQQMRWCSGSTTLLTNPEFWKSDLNYIQKLCYMSGMMYYTAAGLMIFLAALPGLMLLWIDPSMVKWYNFAYAFPSLIYSVFVFRLWSRQRYNFNVNFVFTIQQFAYLMAIKDRIFGTTANWVPSGDTKSHDTTAKKKKGGNNKYRNMRILCGVWMYGSATAIAVGVTLRVVQGHAWWNFIPLVLLDAFNLFVTHKFIFCTK